MLRTPALWYSRSRSWNILHRICGNIHRLNGGGTDDITLQRKLPKSLICTPFFSSLKGRLSSNFRPGVSLQAICLPFVVVVVVFLSFWKCFANCLFERPTTQHSAETLYTTTSSESASTIKLSLNWVHRSHPWPSCRRLLTKVHLYSVYVAREAFSFHSIARGIKYETNMSLFN